MENIRNFTEVEIVENWIEPCKPLNLYAERYAWKTM